jgi:TRAP transporter 4TM/12TM fusion protein
MSISIVRPDEHPVRRYTILALAVSISLLHIWFNTLGLLSTLWQNGLHYAGFALLCVLTTPWSRDPGARGRVMRVIDLAWGMLAAFSAVYMVSREDAIYANGVRLATPDWIFGVILILTAIELTRRTTGWIIPAIIVIALSYISLWGPHISGVFKFAGLKPETLLFRSVYGDDALFGNIALISSSFVFMFILFGAFLLRSGAGDFIIDMARAVAGRTVGGPGLVAVIASGLTGTISGSAIANTASTGVITIPLMIKAGFKPRFAAGVEATASTGGQLMPPIMGAGAFVMASYTQIPYPTIVAVSFLPAILYFASVGFYVRTEARKLGLEPTEDETVKLGDVIRQGGFAFLIPITVLIGLLVWGFTPTYAAGISILAVVVASWFTPNRMGPRAIFEALALGARNMVMTAILLCSVGLVVNVIATAGIGNTFSVMITEWSGDSILIAVVLVALASLILGMGLPVTAAYIVLGTLSAPALYGMIADAHLVQVLAAGNVPEEARALFMLAAPDHMAAIGQPMTMEMARTIMAAVPMEMSGMLRDQVLDQHTLTYALLSAHMIIFWLSQDSNVTPPVCLAAFTGAAIAKTPPMATGLTAWKIAKGLYIVPLLFAYTDFLGGSWQHDVVIFLFGLLGIYALVGGMQGCLERVLNWPERTLSFAAGVAMLWPSSHVINLVAAVIFVGLFMYTKRRGLEPAAA